MSRRARYHWWTCIHDGKRSIVYVVRNLSVGVIVLQIANGDVQRCGARAGYCFVRDSCKEHITTMCTSCVPRDDLHHATDRIGVPCLHDKCVSTATCHVGYMNNRGIIGEIDCP